MLSFKFTPSPNDVTRAFWIFYLNDWTPWTIMAFTATILGACGLIIFATTTFWYVGFWQMVTLLPSFILACFLVFSLLLVPYLAGRRVKHDERLNSPVEYQASEEHLLFRNRFSEMKLDWCNYNRVIESPKFFLLVCSASKNRFQIIPKRAFRSSADEFAFQGLLKSKISGSYSKGVDISLPTSVIVTVSIILIISTLLCGWTVVSSLIRIVTR